MNIIVGQGILDRSFLTGTSDFGKVGGHQRRFSEWETRNSGDRASTFKSQLRGTSLQKREELNFAVRSTVAKFGVDFYKDVCCEWVERHMLCALCGGSFFK